MTACVRNTRREYRRLLVSFALTYFDREVRVRDLDRARVQQFVDWLTTQPGRDGRLRDRSIANAITPFRLALEAAVAEGLLATTPFDGVVSPRRRAGRAWEVRERRFLTRQELARLLEEAPPKWLPLFELLAATGLRISEAIALRWSDLHLEGTAPRLQASRAIVKGVVGAPKSRHGKRPVPLPTDPAATLSALRPANAPDDAFVCSRPRRRAVGPGGPSPPGARACSGTCGSFGRRVSHAAPHLCVAADRVWHERVAPAALDGTSLPSVHARGLRPRA
jgi:integrase